MDDMSPEEILAQAQAAAREAAVELTMRKPNSQVKNRSILIKSFPLFSGIFDSRWSFKSDFQCVKI